MKDVYEAGWGDVAAQLKANGWKNDGEIGDALVATFDLQAGNLSRAIKDIGGSGGDIAAILKNKRSADAATATQCLEDLGFNAGEVARALKDRFGLGREDLKSTLESAGFSVKEVAQVLMDLFGAAPPPSPPGPGGREGHTVRGFPPGITIKG
jgi:hypothetical protein